MLIGYARISTIDQHLDLQIDALERAGCEMLFSDEGVSGAKDKRPGLEQTLESLKAGDVLVVWKLDRLGRSVQHLAQISKNLEDRGIGFYSITDNIDTSTPIGKLFFYIIAAIAEYERALLSERTKAGMEAARARGVRIGRPPKLTSAQQQALLEFDSSNLDMAANEFGVDTRNPVREKTRH